MLPKAWLAADLEVAFAQLAREVEGLRQRMVSMQEIIDVQGRRIEALRKRISEQRKRMHGSPRPHHSQSAVVPQPQTRAAHTP